MPEWLQAWPFPLLFAAGVLGAAMRSQGTYWLGRGVAAQVLRKKWVERFNRPGARRAITAIERWGMPVVPLSFLTVGFQTAVNGAAGLLRIGWLRYTLWAVPGWFLWSLLWVGGGVAAIWGAVELAAQSPWALAGAVVVVTLAVLLLVLRGRRRREQREAVEALAEAAPVHPGQDDGPPV